MNESCSRVGCYMIGREYPVWCSTSVRRLEDGQIPDTQNIFAWKYISIQLATRVNEGDDRTLENGQLLACTKDRRKSRDSVSGYDDFAICRLQ